MQQLHKQVEGKVDAVVGSSIEAVVPTLDVVVDSDRQHVNRPRSGRPHFTGNPVVFHVLYKCFRASGAGAVFETLEFWQNSGCRQERQRHQLSDIVVGTAVSPVGLF